MLSICSYISVAMLAGVMWMTTVIMILMLGVYATTQVKFFFPGYKEVWCHYNGFLWIQFTHSKSGVDKIPYIEDPIPEKENSRHHLKLFFNLTILVHFEAYFTETDDW